MSEQRTSPGTIEHRLLQLAEEADGDVLTGPRVLPLIQAAGLFSIAAALQDLAAAVRSLKET